jgi:hypothetical protein
METGIFRVGQGLYLRTDEGQSVYCTRSGKITGLLMFIVAGWISNCPRSVEHVEMPPSIHVGHHSTEVYGTSAYSRAIILPMDGEKQQ